MVGSKSWERHCSLPSSVPFFSLPIFLRSAFAILFRCRFSLSPRPAAPPRRWRRLTRRTGRRNSAQLHGGIARSHLHFFVSPRCISWLHSFFDNFNRRKYVDANVAVCALYLVPQLLTVYCVNRSLRRVFETAYLSRYNDKFNVSQLALGHSRRGVKGQTISMALVGNTVGKKGEVATSSSILAYDLIQGELVRWSSVMDRSLPDPPTAVFLHGILGCRKNWGGCDIAGSFARRLALEFPTWQFLLVDLRCHGDSASMKKRGPHTVASAASDVLKLVRDLRITPRVLVGHSFGGKAWWTKLQSLLLGQLEYVQTPFVFAVAG
ncbi:hypothetical protein V8G54_006781 [Vigna mungo]|uniref:AB hydrolase-1 domain-containing protein n=1 Tax=Vigna mungo TaxID=3915 RepID=A0AAQ3S8F1_VIGMU